MTTPSGKLAWGQAGAYDAIDDRSVISAVTGFRTGLVTLPVVTAGSGLNFTVKAGWAGIADCGDLTSAVVGSRSDQNVTALAGPATGSRTDYIWCDVQPDAGTWSLTVINATAAAGRSGLLIATLTVPANASLASQMTVAPAVPSLERRVLVAAFATETNTRTGNTWDTVGTPITAVATASPGRWYKVEFIATSPQIMSGGQNSLRAGIGYRAAGGADSSSVLQRSVTVSGVTNFPQQMVCQLMFRHPPASAAVSRNYDGRIWIVGSGSFRTCAVTNQGDALSMTVEDMGT